MNRHANFKEEEVDDKKYVLLCSFAYLPHFSRGVFNLAIIKWWLVVAYDRNS